MATITPVWTDGTTIQAISTLARGAVGRSTYAVTSKFGAFIYVYLGRTGTTAITTSGIQVRIRRVINGIVQLTPIAAFTGDTAAAVTGAAAASGNNVGSTTITLNASTTFAVGTNNEIWCCIMDSTSSPTTVTEWVRVSVQTSVTAKLIDSPSTQAHNSTGHTMSDKANVFSAYVEGGCTYEIIVDYGAAGAGDTYVYQVLAQSLDSLSVV